MYTLPFFNINLKNGQALQTPNTKFQNINILLTLCLVYISTSWTRVKGWNESWELSFYDKLVIPSSSLAVTDLTERGNLYHYIVLPQVLLEPLFKKLQSFKVSKVYQISLLRKIFISNV